MSKKYDQMKKRIYDLELLVGLQPTPVSTLNPCNSACEEITMNTANATVTVEKKTYETERRSLRDAVFTARTTKDSELRKHYNIDCIDSEDLSPKELVDAIKSDKFKYKEDGEYSEKKNWYCSPLSGICFCDPDKKPNHEDYYKARDKMTEDANKVNLDISVLEPSESLKSYRKFEERKYH